MSTSQRAGRSARSRTRAISTTQTIAATGSLVLLSAWRLSLPFADRRTRSDGFARMLGQLSGAGWSLVDGIRLGRERLTHVVVGPGGLYVVVERGRPGRVQANRVDPNLLVRAGTQAEALERVTGHAVEPVLVFTHAPVEPPVSCHFGVTVLAASDLAAHLAAQPRRLSPADVGLLRSRLAALG
jgi:hypothetical protein